MDTENKINEDEVKDVENWRNEHGLPDYKYLQSLADNSSVESMEKLRSIAEDTDADYDPDATANDIIQAIRLETERNEDDAPIVTT